MIFITSQQRFDYAVKYIMQHEGGYSNNPNDPGGATNFGISLRFLNEFGIDINHDGLINIKDIQDIHFTDAVDIYKTYYWDKYNLNGFNSLPIAAKLFDMGVNMGMPKAIKILQFACQFCGYKNLQVDGVLGILTFSTVNELTYLNKESELMNEIIKEQKEFYINLTIAHPELKVFLKGWLNRAEWNPDGIS